MAKRLLIVQQPGKGLFEKGKMKSILKKGGYTVVGDTTTNEDYVHRFRWEKPDLVLLESFPFGDGEGFSNNIEALVNIRHAEDTVWSGPLVMYGRPGDNVDEDGKEWMDEYLTRGIDDFILQPFEESELFNRIDRLLSLPKADVRTDDKMQVLIQQGSLSDRAWLNTVLERNGYSVRHLSEGSSPCLEYLKHHIGTSLEPDLLIAEDFTTLVCVRKEYPDIPVLICSYKNSLDYVAMCTRAGAKSYLLKPFKIEEFLKRVDSYCQNSPRQQRQKQAEAQKQTQREAGKIIMSIAPVRFLEFPAEIQNALDENGYTVITAPTELDYLAVYRKEKPNLVVLRTSDEKVLENLKKEDPSVRVLMLLDYQEKKNVAEKYLKLGAADCLTEPFDAETLLTCVEGLRRRPGAVQPKKEEPPAPPPPSPEPEDSRTAYSRKIAGMTTEELLAEVERVTGRKVIDTIARVLVVQKEEFMQTVIQDALKKDRFEVTGMTSEGWRCLELYRETKPDLVIMDTVLAGGIDGIKILQLLRKEDPPARVLMTGPLDTSAAKECVESGAKEFLAKPFHAEQLLKKVRDAIRR